MNFIAKNPCSKNKRHEDLKPTINPREKGSITSKWASRQRALALVDWLGHQPFHLAATITFRRYANGNSIAPTTAKKITRKVIFKLERSVFGNLTRRKGLRLVRATFLGRGILGGNPHIHMAIAKPQDIAINILEKKLASILRNEKSIGKVEIKGIWSDGWIDYMTHHGVETFEEDLSCLATPIKG